MTHARRAVLLLVTLAAAGCAASHGGVAERVDALLARQQGKTIAVAYYDLDRGTSLLRNEREVFHAASTMKVPVMLGVFEAVSRGALRLDQPVMVRNDFVSILDGSHFALDHHEDSDPALYDAIGTAVPLEELVRRMIDRSSNLATDLVIQLVGAPQVMDLMHRIGADDIRVLRGVEDDKAYQAGMNNTVTANDLMLIFKALAEKRVVSPEASDRMLEILLGQELNDGIPAGLPKGTRVAHKTGSITEIAHDAGLVIEPNGSRYILVVLTRGYKKTTDAERVIARISRAVAAGRRE
jgi:beta-lactamase class A